MGSLRRGRGISLPREIWRTFWAPRVVGGEEDVMSALEFLMRGGMASTGGDLSEDEQKLANGIVKAFGESAQTQARQLAIPASANVVFRSTYLLVVKDRTSVHFAFAEKPGGNAINYRDCSSLGQIPLSAILQDVRNEIGEVAWAFSVPASVLVAGGDYSTAVALAAKLYLGSVLERAKSGARTTQVQGHAAGVPDLAPFVAKFQNDHPPGVKTALVMMSFASTPAHKAIFEAVKVVLAQHDVEALRADSKEYSDELLANIRTYMHCCAFGIGIFERILQDDFNPNVSLETGYMLGLGKPVCLLKDGTLKSLPSDLVGKLYKKYDPQRIAETVGPELVKWMKDRSII